MHSFAHAQTTTSKQASLQQAAACLIVMPSLPIRRIVSASASKKDAGKQADPKAVQLSYGDDWYSKTRELSKTKRTVREEIEYRRAANLAANNGRERKDLYTDNWDGSEYKGSPFNILTLVTALFFLVPIAGLAFAFFTYGDLWG